MIAYDAKGRKVGSSMGLFGNINHYDNKGHKVGPTQKDAFSDDHYDSKGHRVAKSYPGWFVEKNSVFEY